MASSDVKAAIARAAIKYGVDPRMLMTFARIESSGNPGARTGSYKGLFQLSDSEFSKYGGGDIYSATDNANAGAAKLKAEMSRFREKYGREPSAADLYMVHQQGEGGYAKHAANPDGLAWQNMYATAEGRAKGPGWAKQAIWGNVPDDLKAKYGSVENMTSKQFTDMWSRKVDGDTNAAIASSMPSTPPSSGAAAPKEGAVLDILAALGGSSNIMGSLGKLTGSEALGKMGDSNSIFGSLGQMFGGGGAGGGDGGGADGGSANPQGDANMQLAQQGMKDAAGGDEQIQTYQRKPVDLSNLMKIIQQRSQLGAAPRQPGAGLGV